MMGRFGVWVARVWPPQWARLILLKLELLDQRLAVLQQAQHTTLAAARRIERTEEQQMALIDDVLAEAQRNSTIGDSVLALVQQLVDQAGGDPAKLQSILDTLKADSDKLEAAVLANTPQAPTA